MSAARSLLSIYHHYNAFICYSRRLLRRGINREAPRTCELISLLLVAATFIFQILPLPRVIIPGFHVEGNPNF